MDVDKWRLHGNPFVISAIIGLSNGQIVIFTIIM